jgi:glycosyltransferase involved in cell wall biosynthesis
VNTLKEKTIKQHKNIELMLNWYFKGNSFLKKLNTDIIIMNGVVPLGFSPKLIVLHDAALNLNFIERRLYRKIYNNYNKVVCVSNVSKSEAIKLGIRCDKIIYNPIKLSLYKSKPLSERELFVVHIGVRKEKNLWISVETTRILRKRGYNIKLILLGGNPENINQNEKFVIGYQNLPEDKKNLFISKSIALILPSSHEAFSYTVLEAMASGTPAVVSNAVPEEIVKHEFNGLRVNKLNPESFANELEKLLNDNKLWNKISLNGLGFSKKFDYLEISKEYEKLIKDTYNGNNR